MKINRLFLILLTLTLLIASAACGGEEPAVTPDPTSPLPSAADPTSPTDPVSPTEAPTPPTDPAAPTETQAAPTDPAGPADAGQAVADLAVSLVGTPFRSGGTGPDAFDNSGFVYYCFLQNGIKAPRRTSQMVNFGAEVAREDLRPGDAVLFSNDVGGPATFEGIYIGENQFVSCNNPETPTKITDMTGKYWVERFICGRRPE